MIGVKFNKFEVISKSTERKNGVLWVCECSCGNTKLITTADINRERYKHCNSCSSVESKISPIKSLYGNYKREALKRGYTFELTINEFKKLIKSCCNYCESKPKQFFKKKDAKFGVTYNGIDRKDNTKGYTIENSVPCCKFCNFAKSRWGLEEFEEWLHSIIVNNP